jgi:Xaa-Pro aminopeptidase
VFARLGMGRPDVDAAIMGAIASGRRLRPRTGRGLHTLSDPGLILDDMRLVKDDGEIALMREAARISVESFRDAARSIRPGAGEWQVEAALEGAFRMRGASGPAFPSIVAAGANATVLHYVANTCTMTAGDLLLVDAGARRRMYCADISRTFPVSGAFSDAQTDLYDAVLAARDAAIAAVVPGATVDEVHDAALDALVDGLITLGFVVGTRAEAKRRDDAWKPFFPHRTSHWLGLDVHDVGGYVVSGASRPLEPGMVLTIEPGIYIPASTGSGPAELHGTGVRIEDDVLVTATGREVLTAALPADRDSLMALMNA